MSQEPPPYGRPAALPRSGRTATVAVVALGIIAAVAIGAGELTIVYTAVHHAIAKSSPSTGGSTSESMPTPVTASSTLEPGEGVLVFKDDFQDSGSGWSTGTASSGTTYTYSSSGYIVVAKQSLHHIVRAPYDEPLMELGISMTATQNSDAPAGAGFGVTCIYGAAATQVRYEILVLVPGAVFVERRSGVDALTTSPVIIKEATSPATPGSASMTVVGMCATLPDHHTTRLALFVNGTLVVDVSDYSSQEVTGWTGGMVFSSRDSATSTDTVTHYEERDLDR